jgi:hypothetical protein
MKKPKLPAEFIKKCRSVKAKRPKTVIDHILKHGFITTEELKEIYGYNHPPRAARDVREQGIPLETFKVQGSDKRTIAAYRFGNPTNIRKLYGRTAFSKKLKDALLEKDGAKCAIYLEEFPIKELQIDHRIPFEVIGDVGKDDNINDYMLLSASANRAKSWSCEHCVNWNQLKKADVCKTCYWAFPEQYQHVAMRQIRRLDLLWQGSEVKDYDQLKGAADELNKELPEFVKEILHKTELSHD